VIRLAMVEDHVLMRQLLVEELVEELNSLDDIEVVAEFSTCEELLARINQLRADMIMMDVTLPAKSGIEGVKELRELGFNLPILCLTMHFNESTYQRAMQAGASGYAVKQEPFDELLKAIRRVAEGKHYVSAGLGEITDISLNNAEAQKDQALLQQLTSRECEIIKLIAAGKTTAKISADLNISERTVDFHRRNASEKTNLKGIAEITRFAIRTGLFK